MKKNTEKKAKKENVHLNEAKLISNHLLKLTELQMDLAMKLQVALKKS